MPHGWKSGSAADRTAIAAERTAAAAEEESQVSRELIEFHRAEHAAFLAEQARAPIVDLSCRVTGAVDLDAAGRRVMLQLGWRNTGTKGIRDAGVNFIVPVDAALWRSDSSGAVEPLPGTWLLQAPDHILNSGCGSHYLARTIDAPLQSSMLMYVAVDVPTAGRYPVELKPFHEELVPAVQSFCDKRRRGLRIYELANARRREFHAVLLRERRFEKTAARSPSHVRLSMDDYGAGGK